MAARRSGRRRRRGGFGILFKLLSFLLILGALIAGCIVFFRVEEIRVSGSEIYTQEQIAAASGVEKGDNLFLVGKVSTARKILQELPYIKGVKPYWQLPDKLIIEVTDCTPVCAVEGQGGALWLMDESCKLLEQVDAETAGQYARITGVTPLKPAAGSNLAVSVEESGKADALKQILLAAEDRKMTEKIGAIDLSGTTEIIMTYEGRFRVRLPAYSDDFHKLVHTLEEIAAYLNAGQKGTVDLTGSRGRFIPDVP